MVFSSLPSYLDPPNWPQQHQIGGIGVGGGGGGDHEISQLPPPLLPPPPPLGSGGDGRSALQMSERARMGKLPQPPETAMKCPRCESTNTKFCYFNNYSLSQPRHFCKTCRRYWTRGGALRNVPVGGGCRRNKKSSSKGSRGGGSRSKSPSATTTSSTSNTAISPNSCTTDILGHLPHNTRPSQFPILPPLHHYGGGDLGLTFGGGNGNNLIHLGHDSNNNKFAQFPFLEAAANAGMYGEGPSNYGGQIGGLKMEENHHRHHQHQQQGLNLSRNFMGIPGNEQFLGTSNVAWSTTDLSGFTSSSTTTTHLL